MRIWASVALLAAAVAAVSAQSVTASKFDVLQCYRQDINNWMPNTLDNLIALIEKFELKNTFTTMDDLAEMLLTRYRKDGIVYRPGSGASDWTMDETSKAYKKQALIELISRPTTQPPLDTFDLREECALHRMLSHSTDDYPIAGIDDLWNTALPSTSGRVKRSSSSSSAPVAPMAAPLRAQSVYEAAVHPLERGVIETPYGPVAGGTLLAGLMSISNNPSSTIQTVLGSDSDYMPTAMKSRTLIPVYAATLAGDLGELALWTRHSTSVGSPTVGPPGRFHNCTTCSKQFSLKSNAVSFLSRAEIFAGLDALILTAAYTKSGVSGSNSLKLSQLLRLYYSEKGLPGMPDYKACNRINLYKSVPDKTRLNEQALNFMYAYTKDFADQKYYIEQTTDYLVIEQEFSKTLTQAVVAMDNFIGSYSYDDEGASRCYFSSGESSWSTGTTSKIPLSEGSADLVAIYAEEGSTEYMEKERQMIADVARRLGVSTRRSRLGVLRAKDATWIQPLQNISNIADWGCNFTMDTLYQSGSSSNRGDIFTVILGELTNFYDLQYRLAFAELATSSGRSQVVVWQVPSTVPGDLETNKKTIRAFRLRFPDVSIIFVGRNGSPYLDLLDDEDDFISFSNKNLKSVTDETVNRIHLSPRFFMYPACDPNNSTITNNYIEASHIYEGAVTPNVTTYIRIPPQTFHYSEELQLQVQGKVRACFSRTNRLALENVAVKNLDTQRDKLTDDQVQCIGGPNDKLDKVTYKWLCDRYIQTCNPVYVSVTGLDTAGARLSCNSDTDPECDFPNQIQYSLSHTGMICGASCTAPALLLLLLPALLQYFLH